MRPEQWTANALAFAIACGMTAAIAQSQTAIAEHDPAASAGHAQAAALAQDEVQRRNKSDFPRQRQGQRDVEREEMEEEEAVERMEVGEGLTEEQATQLAADRGLIRGTSAIGKSLYDTDGEQIGEIQNFAIDTERNQVALVVVSFGGQFGFGDDYVAVPFQAFQPADDAEGLATDLTREELEGADRFSPNDWPDMTSRNVVRQAYEQFGYDPYWTQGAGAAQQPGAQGETEVLEEREDGVVEEDGEIEARREREGIVIEERGIEEAGLPIARATELLGRPIRSTMEDDKLGTLSDMIIDGREGRVVYGVLTTGGFFGFGEELALVPYRALRYQEADDQFALDADEEAIDAVAFEDDNWPDLTNERWASSLHLTFNEEPYWQTFGYVSPAADDRERGMRADETPRDILEEAGVAQQEIRAIEEQGYPRRPVEIALQEAYRAEGVGADEAQQRAREEADRIEELRQQQEMEGEMEGDEARQILLDAGLTDEEIDELEAGGYEENELRSRLEEAYLDEGMSEQEARDSAREDTRRILESTEMQDQEREERYMNGEEEQQETEEQEFE